MREPPPSPPPRRVRLIQNPISGLHAHGSAGEVVSEVLSGGGVEVEPRFTEAPGHATELAREACAEGIDAVVAIGGDGTVNEVANGIEGTATALATVPLGTSNMLARELAIPFDHEAAAKVILAGRRRRLDMARANGKRFLMVAGVGWDAEIVETVAAARKGHLGQYRYVLPIARAVMEYDFPPLSVRVDGKNLRGKRALAFACNTRNYAAWFALAADARPDDGLLDFVLFRGGHPRNFLRWAVAALLGRLHRYREVEVIRGRELLVRAAAEVPYQVDGDPGGKTPLTITVEPASLEVIVP